MRHLSALSIMCILLGGCSTVSPQASDLQGPSPRLMQSPAPLPPVVAGADSYQDNAQCSTAYVRETGKLKSLQGYVTTVLKK